jgi:L-asparaginase / beta-aspartyl-peptidase
MQKGIWKICVIAAAVCFFACSNEREKPVKSVESTAKTETMERPDYVLVIHGGAGTILKKHMTPEKEEAYHLALNEALTAGEAILSDGGDAMDAVEAAVRIMEDSPLFNAGKGAVFTHDGVNEMDASFMSGSDLACGAIAGVRHVKNPISLARKVMEESEHVFLSGAGAEAFAKSQGLELVDAGYFFTESRWKSLQKALKMDDGTSFLSEDEAAIDEKFGTVGAVALDKQGHLAAATSTGGMTNKRWGRIGDSPVIGAGTYADDRSCAVSCTGHGEFFIRLHIASRVSAAMIYGGKTLEEAGEAIIHGELGELGGTGGLIAVDKDGRISMPFNTAGMYRGYTKAGERYIGIYGDDGE